VRVVVTGGAGYIGAHVVRLLTTQGCDVIVLDDLSFGRADRIGSARLVTLDLAMTTNLGPLTDALAGADAVIHLAARKQVGESMSRPAWYYQQNVGGMAQLLLAMEAAGVRKLVYSSSAATYGMPDVGVVTEDTPLRPINPYGETKVVGEQMAGAAARAWGLSVVSLRYFNVAGAGWPDLGDPAVLNLVPMVFEPLSAGEPPRIFGDDHPTPDGTCVRDYVHVMDLAEAHLTALKAMDDGGTHAIFNVGTGRGYSVREVVAEVFRASGLVVPPVVCPRREGDPALLIADPTRIRLALGWEASRGLEEIVASAWAAWGQRAG